MTKEMSKKVLFANFGVVPEPSAKGVWSTAVLQSIGNHFDTDALTLKDSNLGHIERFHGSRLLRVPVGSEDIKARAEAFDRAVRRQIDSEEYDIVHFTDPFSGYPLCEYSLNANYKTIYDARGFPSIDFRYTDPHLENDRKFLIKTRRREIFCLMHADMVLTSTGNSVEYITSLGVSQDRIHILPPPVDIDAFSVDFPSEDEPCRLLYIGSHASWQGLPGLLFALEKLPKDINFKAKIVGPSHGSWQHQLNAMIRQLELRKKVKLEHSVPHEDIPEFMEWAHVGLAPLVKVDRNLQQSPLPLKIAEYLVAGRPVITSDIPVCSEMVEDGVTGLLYPPTDEEALAKCIERLCKDPDLRKKLSTEARIRGSSRFDGRSFKKRILQIYHSLLSLSGEEDLIRFALEPTPTGTSRNESTVTLRENARTIDGDSFFSADEEPVTQTSILFDDSEKEIRPEPDTGPVCVADLPWSDSEEQFYSGTDETPVPVSPLEQPEELASDVKFSDEDDSSQKDVFETEMDKAPEYDTGDWEAENDECLFSDEQIKTTGDSDVEKPDAPLASDNDLVISPASQENKNIIPESELHKAPSRKTKDSDHGDIPLLDDEDPDLIVLESYEESPDESGDPEYGDIPLLDDNDSDLVEIEKTGMDPDDISEQNIPEEDKDSLEDIKETGPKLGNEIPDPPADLIEEDMSDPYDQAADPPVHDSGCDDDAPIMSDGKTATYAAYFSSNLSDNKKAYPDPDDPGTDNPESDIEADLSDCSKISVNSVTEDQDIPEIDDQDIPEIDNQDISEIDDQDIPEIDESDPDLQLIESEEEVYRDDNSRISVEGEVESEYEEDLNIDSSPDIKETGQDNCSGPPKIIEAELHEAGETCEDGKKKPDKNESPKSDP